MVVHGTKLAMMDVFCSCHEERIDSPMLFLMDEHTHTHTKKKKKKKKKKETHRVMSWMHQNCNANTLKYSQGSNIPYLWGLL